MFFMTSRSNFTFWTGSYIIYLKRSNVLRHSSRIYFDRYCFNMFLFVFVIIFKEFFDVGFKFSCYKFLICKFSRPFYSFSILFNVISLNIVIKYGLIIITSQSLSFSSIFLLPCLFWSFFFLSRWFSLFRFICAWKIQNWKEKYGQTNEK